MEWTCGGSRIKGGGVVDFSEFHCSVVDSACIRVVSLVGWTGMTQQGFWLEIAWTRRLSFRARALYDTARNSTVAPRFVSAILKCTFAAIRHLDHDESQHPQQQHPNKPQVDIPSSSWPLYHSRLCALQAYHRLPPDDPRRHVRSRRLQRLLPRPRALA